MLNNNYKNDFPYFKTKKNYLDNRATTQKPQLVIDSMNDYYTNYCANIHRSNNSDSNFATTKYEEVRTILQKFINRKNREEIVFTKGVTESINLIANSFVKNNYNTVIISRLEHHSNILPWFEQGKFKDNGLKVIKYDEGLNLDLNHYEELLKNNPNSFVSVTHISNAFGKILPIKKMSELAHKYNSLIMVDGAQRLSHLKIDVIDLDVDFYCFSSHKSFGPTGVGAIYIKKEHLDKVDKYQVGGATINKVTFDSVDYLESPYCFERGTQNIRGIIGFGSSLKYINSVSYKKIKKIDNILYEYTINELSKIKDIIFYNDNKNVVSNISFNIKNVSCEDIGILLDKQKILVRSGNHCVQPLMNELGIEGTIRVSLSLYNDTNDIDNFINGLKKAIKMLRS